MSCTCDAASLVPRKKDASGTHRGFSPVVPDACRFFAPKILFRIYLRQIRPFRIQNEIIFDHGAERLLRVVHDPVLSVNQQIQAECLRIQ
jgi:hypothetical protein